MQKFIGEVLSIIATLLLTAFVYFVVHVSITPFNTPQDAKLIAQILAGIFFFDIVGKIQFGYEEVAPQDVDK